jgi:hypothetical protein
MVWIKDDRVRTIVLLKEPPGYYEIDEIGCGANWLSEIGDSTSYFFNKELFLESYQMDSYNTSKFNNNKRWI